MKWLNDLKLRLARWLIRKQKHIMIVKPEKPLSIEIIIEGKIETITGVTVIEGKEVMDKLTREA